MTLVSRDNVGSPEAHTSTAALCQCVENGREGRLLLASGREVQRLGGARPFSVLFHLGASASILPFFRECAPRSSAHSHLTHPSLPGLKGSSFLKPSQISRCGGAGLGGSFPSFQTLIQFARLARETFKTLLLYVPRVLVPGCGAVNSWDGTDCVYSFPDPPRPGRSTGLPCCWWSESGRERAASLHGRRFRCLIPVSAPHNRKSCGLLLDPLCR